MKYFYCHLSFFCLVFCGMFAPNAFSQTSVGIGIYPTGTETGFGFRSGKNSTFCLDFRITKANFYSEPNKSSFLTELNPVVRLIKLEKVKFHAGLGLRAEWNMDHNNKYGLVLPIGIEAFPFPFQNAGLFFEAAPFFTHDLKKSYYAGLRTVAGFVFYFPSIKKETETVNK